MEAVTYKNSLPCGLQGVKSQRARLVVTAAGGKKAPVAKDAGKGLKGGAALNYGADWYTKTRELARPRTVREEIEYRRQANLIANNGKERKDLYTENWDGSEYKGSPFNILTLCRQPLRALHEAVHQGTWVGSYRS